MARRQAKPLCFTARSFSFYGSPSGEAIMFYSSFLLSFFIMARPSGEAIMFYSSFLRSLFFFAPKTHTNKLTRFPQKPLELRPPNFQGMILRVTLVTYQKISVIGPQEEALGSNLRCCATWTMC